MRQSVRGNLPRQDSHWCRDLFGAGVTPIVILNHKIPDNNVVAAWYRSDMGVTLGTVALVDGDMEAADASAWTLISTPTLTKEGNAKAGSRCLRITGPQYCGARQAVLTIGRTYRLTGWARGDGVGYPVLSDTSSARWVGTTSTDWQWFDVTFVAAGGSIALYQYGAGTRYVEWDALTAECLSASAWADQSGNARHLLQGVAGAQPALVAGGTPNGKPVLRFDGSDDLVKFADAGLVQPFWLFLAVKWTYKASATILIDGTPAGASNQIYNSAGTTTLNLVAGAGMSKAGVASATWQVLEFGSNGVASAIAVNGGAQTIGNAGALAPGGITIGAGTGGALAAIADVSEIVAVSAVPTAAQRAALTAYLRSWSGV